MHRILLSLALAAGLAGHASAATVGSSVLVPLSSFGDNDVACTTGGIPVGPAGCSTSATRSATFYLDPFDVNLGTLTSAVLTYSYRIKGNFITRTPVVAGEGHFRTDASVNRGGTTIASATTGDVSYLSSTLQNEGTIGQRIDPYSLNIDGSVALDIAGVTYDPLAGDSDQLSYLFMSLYFTIEAGIGTSPSCAFGGSICGATNRVTAVESLRDLGPVAGVFSDALVQVVYTYEPPAPPPPSPSAVPLPAASLGLLSALAGLAALRRRKG